MTYEILSDNMPRLQKKLQTIQNKCEKYGCSFTFREVGEVYRTLQDTTREHHPVYKAKFIVVEVEGAAKVDDWEFVATIEHSKPFNIIRSFQPEIKVPDVYYTADPRCDHCNTLRTRKDTYIIRNAITGEFKQVGKSCIKDFTHGLSAEMVASYVSWFDELIKGEAPIKGYTRYYKTVEVLQYAVESVRLYGYSNNYSQGVSTKEVVRTQMFQLSGWDERAEKDGFNPDRVGNTDKVQDILAWVEGLPEEFGYNTNLKSLFTKEFCENRDFGLICSAVVSYDKAMERKSEEEKRYREDSKSNWVGIEGDRLELRDLSVRCLTSWETEWGYTYLYKLTSAEGNVFIWKTGVWLGSDGQVSLRGTVKSHEEYKGTRQTILTRCKVL